MESSKYYTPEIEDFHVGFEYEVNTGDKWIPEIQLDGYIHNKKLENIRVKYLDKEDVESLGWFYTGRSTDLWFNKVGLSDSASGAHKFTEYKLHFGTHDHVLKINAYFGNQDEGCLFEGVIHNKSELRKLMKQLKIKEALNGMS